MISFPFDGTLTTVETLTAADEKTVDVPVSDRGYDSKTLQTIYDSLYTDGIYQEITNCLKVSPGTGMNVIVSPGVCKSGGAFGIEESQRTLAVQAAHATLDRIDAVVARKDNNNTYRNIDLYVVQGTPASSPKAPEPTRNSSVYEIVLAHVFVAKGTTSIASYRITDTRLNSSLCGLMQGRPGTDTTGIFDQYQSALDEFLSLVQSALDETTAGNLQRQIDEMIGKVYPVGSIYMSVSPVNPGELFGGTWEEWGSGMVPVGVKTSDSSFNDVEKQGGAKTIDLSHTHTVNSHSHGVGSAYAKIGRTGSNTDKIAYKRATSGVTETTFDRITTQSVGITSGSYPAYSGGVPGDTTALGGNTDNSSPKTNAQLSNSQSILQPYITCYMWKRTA